MGFNTIYSMASSYFTSLPLSFDKKPCDQLADEDGHVRGID